MLFGEFFDRDLMKIPQMPHRSIFWMKSSLILSLFDVWCLSCVHLSSKIVDLFNFGHDFVFNESRMDKTMKYLGINK